MSDFIDQFFGDAKRLSLSPKEKATLWGQISALSASKKMSLSSLEKADAFTRIAKHMQRHPIAVPRTSLSGFWQFHKLAASTMVALLIVTAGGGTAVYAAEDAMPDDVLYPVKLHVNERIVEALQRTPQQRAAWEAKRLQRRLKEAEHVASNRELREKHQEHMRRRIEERMEHLNNVLNDIPAQEQERIAELIDAELEEHETFLEEMEEEVMLSPPVQAFRRSIGDMHDDFRSRHGKPPRGELGDVPPPVRRSSKSSQEARSSWQQPERPQRKKEEKNTEKNASSQYSEELQLPAEGWLSGRKRTTRNRVDDTSSRGFESPSLRQEEGESESKKDDIKQQNKNKSKENDRGVPAVFRSKHPFFKVNASVHSKGNSGR